MPGQARQKDLNQSCAQPNTRTVSSLSGTWPRLSFTPGSLLFCPEFTCSLFVCFQTLGYSKLRLFGQNLFFFQTLQTLHTGDCCISWCLWVISSVSFNHDIWFLSWSRGHNLNFGTLRSNAFCHFWNVNKQQIGQCSENLIPCSLASLSHFFEINVSPEIRFISCLSILFFLNSSLNLPLL